MSFWHTQISTGHLHDLGMRLAFQKITKLNIIICDYDKTRVDNQHYWNCAGNCAQ